MAPDPLASASIGLSVVVPIFDASSTLSQCIEALVSSIGPNDEVIVVDDGSTDDGVDMLEPRLRSQIRTWRSTSNIGRGPVRNVGARQAKGEVLVFVDADVVVHHGCLERVRQAFASSPSRTAIIGSYDDRPTAPNLVSQYRNLLHHHTHHTHGAHASHFWTGLGAVRRHVFESLGGLDEGRWARDMEDVEFGHRLVDAGHRIDVLPQIQGTHLKRFTLWTMIETDLTHRAIPWSRLMLHDHLRSDRFVASWPQRLSAASAVAVCVSGIATLGNRRALIVALPAFGLFVAANFSLWRFLARVRSIGFALRCVPLHVLHAVLSATGFAFALARRDTQ